MHIKEAAMENMHNRWYISLVSDVIKVYSLCTFTFMVVLFTKVCNGVIFAESKIQLNDPVYFLDSLNIQYTEGVASAKWGGVKGFGVLDEYSPHVSLP